MGGLMAFSLNKVMLIGNLGKDAETRFTTNNLSVTTFTLATTNSFKGKDGNWVNETTWHNIKSWNLSDYFKENLKKGKKFYVEGRISKRDYTDKEGVKRYVTDIVSERLIPLESSGVSDESSSGGQEQVASPDINVEDNEDLPF
jgi:single-strand DNA-binding protein